MHVISRVAATVAAVVATTGLAVVVPAAEASASTLCAAPAAGRQLGSLSPATLGFDPAKLADAVSFGAREASSSVRVYRHGCLAAKSKQDSLTERIPYPLASASKGVLSLVVGRAVTLGKIRLDAPISTYIPGLDAAHGALTTRLILNQVTGLKFSWGSDIVGMLTDTSIQALAAPFAYPPGTHYEYAQSILGVLATIVTSATGTDFLTFAQRELFDRVGIPRSHWVWIREVSGKPIVPGGMALRPDDQAKLAQLMLNEGTWAGQRVISADYLHQAVQGTAANPGYGFLFWLNQGESYKTGSLPVAYTMPHRFFPGSPADTHAFVGALGQLIIVIPSRDIVIIRNGIPNKLTSGEPVEGLSAEFNREFKDIPRRVVLAVTDVAPVSPADSPYNYPPSTSEIPTGPFDWRTLADPDMMLGSLLGFGDYAGCNLLLCGSKLFAPQIALLGLDAATQVTTALVAAVTGL